MNKTITSLLAGVAFAALSGGAAAQSQGGVSVFLGLPSPFYASAPDAHYGSSGYYAPRPVHYDMHSQRREERGHRRAEREHQERRSDYGRGHR